MDTSIKSNQKIFEKINWKERSEKNIKIWFVKKASKKSQRLFQTFYELKIIDLKNLCKFNSLKTSYGALHNPCKSELCCMLVRDCSLFEVIYC